MQGQGHRTLSQPILKSILYDKNMSENNTRLRFAPSPTGTLHIGTARTALFNYLYAKKNNGELLLRIEDTDKERSKKEHEDNIMRSLSWLGIQFDKEPFYQSKREDIYRKYIEKLIAEKKAYYCFCSKEKLEKSREEQRKNKEAPRYSGSCYSLSKEEVEKLQKEEKEFVIRLKIAENKTISFKDLIRGEIKFNTQDIGGDFVIARSDFSALYNLACVVDDYDMKISHIVRGEDHISNTPKQILLYIALEIEIPKFAHVPMLLGPDKKKLSKRHGSTSVEDYKKEGYLPEALVNFISLLGWHPGGEKEIYSTEEIIEKFSLTDCQKSGAVFDIKKLDYINGHYIRKMEIKKLTSLCLPYLKEENLIPKDTKPEEVESYVAIYQERMKKLSEIGSLIDYLLQDDIIYQEDLFFWKNRGKNEAKEAIKVALTALDRVKEWNMANIEEVLQEVASKEDNKGNILWPVRVALSGKKASASPFEIATVLKKERCIKRLEKAYRFLDKRR